ncbi:MAG: alkaline phosphatase family protein [Actinobacteria bacterium]|nr:alkaline phosphatase family protein [Actinomycetota bacterium]
MHLRRSKRLAGLGAGLLLLAACTGGEGTPSRSNAPSPRANAPSPSENDGDSGQAVGAPSGEWLERACTLTPELVKRIRRDVFPGRSPELIAVPQEPNYFGGFIGTSHSGPWDYVQEVPLAFYGPGHIRSQGRIAVEHEPTVTDLAPTLAELLGTDWPDDRPGRAISDALQPGTAPPKLVVVVVWDGGGLNTLRAFPQAWPNLRRIMRSGTWVAATVGSSPSVTPAIHANIGTGAFPSQHGVVDIDIRSGDDTIDSFEDGTPENLEIPTLADLYDVTTDNKAMVGMFGSNAWHYGMMSRGTFHPGGDKDIAALVATDGSKLIGHRRWYSFPPYLNEAGDFGENIRATDLEDGQLDSLWLGNDVLSNTYDAKQTPALAIYTTEVIKSLLEHEDFGRDEVTDLFFVNYKPIDLVGHRWNMLSPEGRSVLRQTDEELGELEAFLNGLVGQGNWVMALTADHGQTPTANATTAWPIDMAELMTDIADRFGVPQRLFDRTRPGHFWLDVPTMEEAGITPEDIADFISDYRLEGNTSQSRPLTEKYAGRADEHLFSSAWPSRFTDDVWGCVRSGAP